MQFFCPDCQAAFANTTHCPKCGGRLLAPQEAFLNAATVAPPPERWQPTLVSRIILGLVATFGLMTAFREFTLAVTGQDTAQRAAQLALRIVAVFCGSLMAATGRSKGSRTGFLVGLVTSGLLTLHGMMTKTGGGVDWWPLACALVYPLVGGVAGWIGGTLWPEAPQLPDALRLSSRGGLFAKLVHDKPQSHQRPTQVFRIIIGACVVFIGIVGSEEIRWLLSRVPDGLFRTGGVSRAAPVGAQLAILMTMIGGVIAGAGTGAGLRHGLLAGLLTFAGAAAVSGGKVDAFPSLVGLYQLLDIAPGPLFTDGPTLAAMIGMTVGALMATAWVGSQLFPPLGTAAQRRTIRLPIA